MSEGSATSGKEVTATRDDLSLGTHLQYLTSGNWRKPEFICWPPDAFAATMGLLHASGAYIHALEMLSDQVTMEELARDWRKTAIQGGDAPGPIRQSWDLLARNADAVLIEELVRPGTQLAHPALCKALLLIAVAADETCYDISDYPDNAFAAYCSAKLAAAHQRSLCSMVSPSRCAVLPKSQTPSVGITTRALSRNLAYVPTTEVAVRAHVSAGDLSPGTSTLDLLVVPWPAEVSTEAFSVREEHGQRFFSYEPTPADPSAVLAHTRKCFDRAKSEGYSPSIVVFPELALAQAEFSELSTFVAVEHEARLVTGVRPSLSSPYNRAAFCYPLKRRAVPFEQVKHHRWRLTEAQAKAYSLPEPQSYDGAWEKTTPCRRSLETFYVRCWLTACSLICEDLARQEPVGALVREIAPSLIIALLMDGPQHENRWPARYASVLAEDPGSAVLTVSSLGMVRLGAGLHGGSWKIGSWTERGKAPIALSLQQDGLGLVLRLKESTIRSRTLDGRSFLQRYPSLASEPRPLVAG